MCNKHLLSLLEYEAREKFGYNAHFTLECWKCKQLITPLLNNTNAFLENPYFFKFIGFIWHS